MKKLTHFVIAILICNQVFAQKSIIGLSVGGGTVGNGVLFNVRISNDVYQKNHDFLGAANDGAYPRGSVIVAQDSMIYGTTRSAGNSNGGVLFRYNPATKNYSVMQQIANSGATNPEFNIVQTANGKMYFTAMSGGSLSAGALMEYVPSTNLLSLKVSLGNSLGSFPESVCIGPGGNIYGVTQNGGSTGGGVLFFYNPSSSTYSVVHNFAASSFPRGGLLYASNGKMYGTTFSGGTNGTGVIFEYNFSTTTYSVLHNFSTSSGENCKSNLIQAQNGKIYGLTETGGANAKGVLFEFDVNTNTYSKKADFNGTNGDKPVGLVQASNGFVYGLASAGGTGDFGVIFKYDITGNTLTKILDFDDTNNGRFPFYTFPVEGCVTPMPSASSVINTCVGTKLSELNVNGIGLKWYNTAAGGSTLLPSSIVANGNTYYVTQTIDGCESIVRKSITVNTGTINVTTNITGGTITVNQSGATYQWVDCNNSYAPISGETNQSFVFALNGNYAVIVNNNGCIDTSACINNVGIKELSHPTAVSVYPNPVIDQLHIQVNQSNTIIEVYSILGVLVKRIELQQTENVISLSDLNAGVYFITVKGYSNSIKFTKY